MGDKRIGGFLLLWLCAGCASHPVAAPSDAPNANLHLALGIQPSPPTSLDPTTFTVRVTSAGGQPVPGADVTIRLAMPTMAMGDNTVVAGPGPAGTYTGRGRFTMAGAWRATVIVSKGAARATQSFPLQVR